MIDLKEIVVDYLTLICQIFSQICDLLALDIDFETKNYENKKQRKTKTPTVCVLFGRFALRRLALILLTKSLTFFGSQSLTHLDFKLCLTHSQQLYAQ